MNLRERARLFLALDMPPSQKFDGYEGLVRELVESESLVIEKEGDQWPDGMVDVLSQFCPVGVPVLLWCRSVLDELMEAQEDSE